MGDRPLIDKDWEQLPDTYKVNTAFNYLAMGVWVDIKKDGSFWVVTHKGNMLSLPMEHNDLNMVRTRVTKWIKSDYKEF